MRRFLGIVLSASLLLSSADGIELLKLPGLITHYIEHRQEQPGLGITEYLALHYNSVHADQPEHKENLPFKSHEHSLACAHLVACPEDQQTTQLQLHFPEFDLIHVPYDMKLRPADGHGVWQPPRRG